MRFLEVLPRRASWMCFLKLLPEGASWTKTLQHVVFKQDTGRHPWGPSKMNDKTLLMCGTHRHTHTQTCPTIHKHKFYCVLTNSNLSNPQKSLSPYIYIYIHA